MAKTTLHTEGESAAHALIRAGHYDMDGAWSFSAEDGNELLGAKGDDWDKYGRWHLGEDPSEPKETKAHWKYPYGKGGKVYRRALANIRSRASQEGDTTVYDAAGRLMRAMDEEEGKKENSMSLRHILGSRFGHFAGASAAAKPPSKEDEEEAAKRAAKEKEEAEKKAAAEEEEKEEEEEEAKRKAKEEEKARRSRRARKSKKADAEDGDPDAEDAGDDDEDDDDDEEMKKAAASGHGFALDAAFRAGARAQRRRCAAIFSAMAAAANPVLAMSLAFETSMTPDAAINVLEKTPSASRSALADRMAGSAAGAVRIAPSAPDAPKGMAAITASWDAALKDFVPQK